MGGVKLPDSGIVYLVTPIVIYSVETHAKYWDALKSVWERARSGTLQILTSELTLAETLVAPMKSGDHILQAAYEKLLCGTEVLLVPITREVMREAARLRAAHQTLRMPDAIHAASAMSIRASVLLTNDVKLRQISGLNVTVLDDVLSAASRELSGPESL